LLGVTARGLGEIGGCSVDKAEADTITHGLLHIHCRPLTIDTSRHYIVLSPADVYIESLNKVGYKNTCERNPASRLVLLIFIPFAVPRSIGNSDPLFAKT
jgi:hypothetical protein